jgi:hypothetical protein
VIFGFIPQAYIKPQNRDLIHANVEDQNLPEQTETQVEPPPRDSARLRQNSVQEKLSALWLDHLLEKSQC